MNAIYHLAGIAVVWVLAVLLLSALCYWLYFALIKRYAANAWLGFRVYVLGEQFVINRHKARVLTAAYQKTKQLAWWERDIIAYSIKQARREGRCVFAPKAKLIP